MILFLDFDNLLVDTRSWIKHDFVNSFIQHGATKEVVLDTVKTFAGAHSDNKPQYTPRRHFKVMQMDQKKFPQFEKSVDGAITRIGRYLFDDTSSFLQSFKSARLILLTYGDPSFQAAKVYSSGIRQFFQEILIVNSDKIDTIESWIVQHAAHGEIVYFLDDKASYFDRAAKFPHVRGIHVLRGAEKCRQPVSHHDVQNLMEAVVYINHHS